MANFDPRHLVDSLVEHVRRTVGRPYVLGVAGAPGSGKSTFVTALAHMVGDAHPDVVVSQAPMDGFHLPNRELERRGVRLLKGIPDTFDALGYATLLHRARETDRGVVLAPEFDRSIEEPVAGARQIPAGQGLLITEGNYLALETGEWPEARRAIDELWGLDVPLDECAERCRRRRIRYGADAGSADHLVATVDVPNGRLVAAAMAGVERVLTPPEIRRLTDRG